MANEMTRRDFSWHLRMSPRSGRVGLADLPLHNGRAPAWLFGRMVKLAREVLAHVVAEYGPGEVLDRLSDPYWFQAFGCALGFDRPSAVRGLEGDFGFHVAGGKGAASRRTPAEIERACEALGHDAAPLVRASRLSAKVDNTALQEGYQLYHHVLLFTRDGRWCVVQQGMSDASRSARRYHWLGDRVTSFVEEPHAAICCDARAETFNMVAGESGPARAATSEVAGRQPEKTLAELARLPHLALPGRHLLTARDLDPARLRRTLLRT